MDGPTDNNPYTFYVPDGYDPDHFMPWVHPFTSVISGPTGSGKSVFVRRFVHHIKHMMTPIPDRILWCYGVYQTLYGTIHLMRQGHDLRYVSRVCEDDHVMGIETDGSMVFSSMKQILNDVHDTDVSVMTLKQ
jgi:GTPase SAR1 family protein